ncbi:hypothetical protein K432DRAFT_433461 [Lepidopterella palustris CBS 459.81]|uniref:Zn(2)-C6 fungal-type domain-containing protein n=1 Tax=Lepidopterella palustris CBS 459.81 TaxID=1314670 RepID=A0A8E2JH85_9PEZI|nr:hypothetical protein K432DRAFT_433461 [Lepidopterella palustris CBS 459.81]
MEVEGLIEVGATAPQQPQDNRAKPSVACLRCRDQKLRCDRELPSCVRCRKQRAACSYPSPPDRKRIAQKTSRSRASLSNCVEHVHRSESSTAAKPGKRQRISDDTKEHRIANPEQTEAAELPTTEVGLLLLEVYFKRIYNATLLFHKSIAFQLYMQNGIPGYLLRAIFAHAAIFLKQVDSPYKRYVKIFPVHTLFEKSWSWARSASQEVLSHADEPTILRIQALQVLQFYYFSRGEIQRAIVHASLAYRLSQLLGYDRLHEDVASPSTNRSMQFDREMRRRCFWASWCSCCIGSKQLDFSRACERVTGLPLPAKFEKGGSVQGVEFKLGQKMEVDWKLSTESLPNHGTAGLSSCSLMAELVKLLGIWTKVQAFISDSPIRSKSQRTNQLNRLVELFDPIERSIHLLLTDLCSRAEFYDESPELLTSVCSIYHLSRLLMHASMVPILSVCPAESPASRESVRKNTEMVLQQATGFAELLQQFVAKDLDMTRLWPFSGYGAFVAGSVFVVYTGIMQSARSADQSVKVPGPDSEEMQTIQTVLEVLSIYWKPLRRLAIKLNKAIDAGQSNDADLITSPTYPWNTRCPGYSLEDYDDMIGVPNNPNPNVSLLRTPYVSFLSEDQPVQGVDRHENGTESYETLPERQVSSHARAATEKAVSPAPDSWYQSASLGDFLMNNKEGGLFDAGWRNTAPAINMWEYPLSLAEMPSRDPMS